MTKLKLTLLLALFVALSSSAFAASVTYQTCFGPTASPCATSGTVTSSPPLFSATYHAQAATTVTPPTTSGFGTLTITCPGACNGGPATASFVVTIVQSMPPSGTHKVTASLSGTFIMKNGSVAVVFNGPVAIHAGGVTTIYAPLPGGGSCSVSSPPHSCTFNLRVLITQVPGTVFLPEPSAELLLGLGGLGLMGLATLSRKMISL